MGYGDLNKKFGWIWLTLFVIFGFYLELRMGDPKWLGNQARVLYRATHVHGAVLAVVNLLYAEFIDGANISDSLKQWGSKLMVAGAVLVPVGIFGLTLMPNTPPILTWLGAIAVIAAVGAIAYGHR